MHTKSQAVECAAHNTGKKQYHAREIEIPEDINCSISTDALKRMLYDSGNKLIPEMRGTALHKLYLRRMKAIRNMKDRFSAKHKLK